MFHLFTCYHSFTQHRCLRAVQSDNKNPERVAAGLKATIHNDSVSDEAKNHARDRLDQMGVDLDVPASTQRAKQTVDTLDEADYGNDLDEEDENLLGINSFSVYAN